MSSVLDDWLARLLSTLSDDPKCIEIELPPEREVDRLCEEVIEILAQEPNVLSLQPPMVVGICASREQPALGLLIPPLRHQVFGDVHGQIHDVLEAFKRAGEDSVAAPKQKFLFLGKLRAAPAGGGGSPSLPDVAPNACRRLCGPWFLWAGDLRAHLYAQAQVPRPDPSHTRCVCKGRFRVKEMGRCAIPTPSCALWQGTTSPGGAATSTTSTGSTASACASTATPWPGEGSPRSSRTWQSR